MLKIKANSNHFNIEDLINPNRDWNDSLIIKDAFLIGKKIFILIQNIKNYSVFLEVFEEEKGKFKLISEENGFGNNGKIIRCSDLCIVILGKNKSIIWKRNKIIDLNLKDFDGGKFDESKKYFFVFKLKNKDLKGYETEFGIKFFSRNGILLGEKVFNNVELIEEINVRKSEKIEMKNKYDVFENFLKENKNECFDFDYCEKNAVLEESFLAEL